VSQPYQPLYPLNRGILSSQKQPRPQQSHYQIINARVVRENKLHMMGNGHEWKTLIGFQYSKVRMEKHTQYLEYQ